MKQPAPEALARWPTRRNHPLWTLIKNRVRIFVREPAALFWVFVFPALLAVALGMAFRDRPPQPSRIGVASDRPDADKLAKLFEGAPDAELVREPAADLQRKLDKGAVDLIVATEPTVNVPPNVPPKVPGNVPPRVASHPDFGAVYRYDPQRSDGRMARLVADRALQRALGQEPTLSARDETAIPVGARYIDFLLPGLIAMNLMGSSLWGVGYGMVQERAKKLMRRFATTPLSKTEFIASYVISRLFFLAGEVVFLIVFGALVFGVEVQGSVATLGLVSLVGVATFTGFGVLCASRTSSVEVVSGLVNALTLPMWLLSGTFFSYERFPEFLQPIIKALPLTALNDALRAIANDAAGLGDVLPQLAVLAGWGIFAFTLGVRLFRWR